MQEKNKKLLKEYHRFLDESGDTTFYGKGKRVIIGENGVSKCFILGTVVDVYDYESYGKEGWPNYYGKNNPLTVVNKISPPSH